MDQKSFDKKANSVHKHVETMVRKLEHGTKKLSPDVTAKTNITYREGKAWLRNWEKAVQDGNRELQNQLFKQGANLIVRETSTGTSIYKAILRQDKKHPATKGLTLEQRGFIFTGAAAIMAQLTSDEIDKLGSDRILQILIDFTNQGYTGPELINLAMHEIEQELAELNMVNDMSDFDIEPGTAFDL